MVKNGGAVDPKIEKRRQKNKVASAKCRERKLKRAQLLQQVRYTVSGESPTHSQEVSNMRSKVEQKRENLQNLKTRIDKYKSFLSRNKDFLTEEEQKKLDELLRRANPVPAPSPEEQKEEDEELSSPQNTIDVTTDQKNTEVVTEEPVNDSGADGDSDATDEALFDDSSSDKEGTSHMPNIQDLKIKNKVDTPTHCL